MTETNEPRVATPPVVRPTTRPAAPPIQKPASIVAPPTPAEDELLKGDEAIVDLQRRMERVESLMPVATGLPFPVAEPVRPVDEDLEREIEEQTARLAELHAKRHAGVRREWPKWVETPAGPRVAESPEHEAELQKLPAPEPAPEPAAA